MPPPFRLLAGQCARSPRCPCVWGASRLFLFTRPSGMHRQEERPPQPLRFLFTIPACYGSHSTARVKSSPLLPSCDAMFSLFPPSFPLFNFPSTRRLPSSLQGPRTQGARAQGRRTRRPSPQNPRSAGSVLECSTLRKRTAQTWSGCRHKMDSCTGAARTFADVGYSVTLGGHKIGAAAQTLRSRRWGGVFRPGSVVEVYKTPS